MTSSNGTPPGPTLLDSTAVLFGHRRLLLVALVVGGLVAAGASLLQEPLYRSSASFMASAQLESSGGGMPAGLLGAARGLGLNLPGSVDDPAALFVPLLESRTLATRVLDREFDLGGETSSLRQRLTGGTATGVGEHFFQKEVLHVRRSLESGLTSVWVYLPDPELAAAVANAAVEELESLSRDGRSRQAGEWVRFTQQRVSEIEARLREDENRLKAFREKNRSIAGSPQLQLEEARLMRAVELQQELFISMRTQSELSRVEELKSVPSIVVVDAAVPASEPFKPRRSLMVAVGALTGLLLGCVLVLLRYYGRGAVAELRHREQRVHGRAEDPVEV